MSERLAEAVLRAAARRGWLGTADLERLLPAVGADTAGALAEQLRRHGADRLAARLDQLMPPPGQPAFGAWTALARLGGGAMGAV